MLFHAMFGSPCLGFGDGLRPGLTCKRVLDNVVGYRFATDAGVGNVLFFWRIRDIFLWVASDLVVGVGVDLLAIHGGSWGSRNN
jgi:hypothetical protein